MQFRSTSFALLLPLVLGISSGNLLAQKAALFESVNKRDSESWDAALQIWEWAEPGYQESKSSALLADMLKDHGFKIDKKVAGIPTAFTLSLIHI